MPNNSEAFGKDVPPLIYKFKKILQSGYAYPT